MEHIRRFDADIAKLKFERDGITMKVTLEVGENQLALPETKLALEPILNLMRNERYS